MPGSPLLTRKHGPTRPTRSSGGACRARRTGPSACPGPRSACRRGAASGGNAAARWPACAGSPAAGRRAARSPSRPRCAAGGGAARRRRAPAGRPAASCTAGPASGGPAPPRSQRNSTCRSRSSSGTRLVGLMSTALASRPRHWLATNVWQATFSSPRRTNSVGICSRRFCRNSSRLRNGSVELAEDVVAVEHLGGGGGGGRRQAEEDARSGRRLPGGAVVRRGRARWPGTRRLEVGLAAAGAGRQAQQRLDQDGLRIPGNGLVVQGQAGFFVAVVQGLRLGADPVQRPEVIHRPVAPALDPGPHRVPPRRTARAAAGRSSSPPRAAHGSGRAETPRRRRPAPAAG